MYRSAWVCAIVILGQCYHATAQDSKSVRSQFAVPPRDYSTVPFWVWNDFLTDEQIIRSLRDLADQKIYQAFVHPRPGLMTPYLSPEWFRLWKVALAEAERLDMKLWLYDENSYPSGFAGGLVPAQMPKSRRVALQFHEVTDPAALNVDALRVFRQTDAGLQDVTDKLRDVKSFPTGKYLQARLVTPPDSPWYGNRSYVDLLRPGVTEKFLEVTLEAYRREIGGQFGRRVPGCFTDEPNINNTTRVAGRLTWTECLPEEFHNRCGYSLLDHLPSLNWPVGDWKRVRRDYYQVLSDLFVERWAIPYHDYCRKHDLELTGHYWDHAWPVCTAVPDNMAMYAWLRRPSIDCLMNQYAERNDAGAIRNINFGQVRMVKELGSVANQLGMRRTLCEAYGAGGWDMRIEDMKRIGDWLYVFGVNTLTQHFSPVSIRGSRKYDHPPYFSYHEPWWEAYHLCAEYFARLSLALSRGDEVNSILLMEPTTTAWMYQCDKTHAQHLCDLGNQFVDLTLLLSKQQVEYDIGCEAILARHGSVEGRCLRIGQRKYSTIVLPPGLENLNEKTVRLLESCLLAGGEVVCCGESPSLVQGRPSDRGANLAKHSGWRRIPAQSLAEALRGAQAKTTMFAIHRNADDRGILFHQRRRLDDGELLFMVNTSLDSPAAGSFQSAMRGCEQWDAQSGEVVAYPFAATAEGVRASFEIAPCGSLLLFLSQEPLTSVASRAPSRAAGKHDVGTALTPVGPMKIRCVEPNVLVLDFVDVVAGGKTRRNTDVFQANQFVYQQHGLPRNPWYRAVQFQDEYVSQTFPSDSGFDATYRFTVDGTPPRSFWLVVEQPNLYRITCNGRSVTARTGQWWLDRSFGKIDITAATKTGENTLTLHAAPMTVFHEIAVAYLLGDFSLSPSHAGFIIMPSVPLKLGPWNDQGLPMYAGGVSYSQQFAVSQPRGAYRLRMPKWRGSMAKVLVNRRPFGYITCQPWECDITKAITPGMNFVEVVVVGTLKNTLGPHHGKIPPGGAWPASFETRPSGMRPAGRDYDTIGYGLFAPFVVESVAR